jgi:hypothetical protein
LVTNCEPIYHFTADKTPAMTTMIARAAAEIIAPTFVQKGDSPQQNGEQNGCQFEQFCDYPADLCERSHIRKEPCDHTSMERKADRDRQIELCLGHARRERGQWLRAHDHFHYFLVEIGVA